MPKLVKTDKKSVSHISLSIEPDLKEKLANIAYGRGLRSISLLVQQIAKGQIVLYDKDTTILNSESDSNAEILDKLERLEFKIQALSNKVEDLTYGLSKTKG